MAWKAHAVLFSWKIQVTLKAPDKGLFQLDSGPMVRFDHYAAASGLALCDGHDFTPNYSYYYFRCTQQQKRFAVGYLIMIKNILFNQLL